MEKKKNKKINIPSVFMGMFTVILIILLFYIVGVLVQFRENEILENGAGSPDSQTHVEKSSKFASYFPNCGLINKNCVNSSCDKYFLCNDKKYLACEIYDCNEDFGIGTMDEEGKIEIRKEIKYERELVKKRIERCRGTIEIIDKNCVDGKFELKIKVVTEGECEIKGFVAMHKNIDKPEEKSWDSADFNSLGENLYLAKLNNCKNITEIIAIGEGGVSIKKIIE